MANTATITKNSITKTGSNYNVSLNVVINDGATDILDFSISAKYNPKAPNMSAIMASLQTQIKNKWDDYIDNQGVFTSATLDSGVTTLQNQVNAYIN